MEVYLLWQFCCKIIGILKLTVNIIHIHNLIFHHEQRTIKAINRKCITLFLDFDNLSVDDLMQNKVQAFDGGVICMICGKSNKHMRRHMKEVHLSAGKDYHCPSCKNNFSCKRGLKNHIIRYHNGDDNLY